MKNFFLLSSLFIFGILVTAEGYFRFFSPQPIFENHTTANFGTPNSFRPKLKRNFDFVGFPFEVKTDSKSLRSFSETPYKKQKNVFRVLCIGGSIFAASGVNNNETFAYYLNKKLNTKASGTNFEAINAGKNTWELADFFTYFKNEGYKYQPDLIIIYFHTGELMGMDFSELEADKLTLKRLSKNQVEITIGGLNFNERLNPTAAAALNFIQSIPLYDFFFFNSHLTRILEKQIRERLIFPVEPSQKSKKLNLKSFMENWDLKPGDLVTWKTDYGKTTNLTFYQSKAAIYNIALARFMELTEKSKTKVLFLSVPSPKEILGLEVNFSETKPFQTTKNPNLYWLELLQPLTEIQNSSMVPLNFPNKIHWTPAGHNATATIVSNFMTAEKLLPLNPASSNIQTKTEAFSQSLRQSNNRISDLLKNQGYDLYIKGMVNKNLGRLNQAESFLTRYLKISPQTQKPMWHLGNLYFLKKEFKKSIKFTTLAVENGYIKTDAVYALLGKSYFNLQQYDKAEDFFKKALEYSPNYFRNRLNFARLLFSKKRYEECLEQLLTANTLFPNQIETLMGITSVYLKLGQKQKAKEALQNILKFAPQNQAATHALKEM